MLGVLKVAGFTAFWICASVKPELYPAWNAFAETWAVYAELVGSVMNPTFPKFNPDGENLLGTWLASVPPKPSV
jgi:hypothetical protein